LFNRAVSPCRLKNPTEQSDAVSFAALIELFFLVSVLRNNVPCAGAMDLDRHELGNHGNHGARYALRLGDSASSATALREERRGEEVNETT